MAPSSQCMGRSGVGLFGNNPNAKTCDALVLGTLLRGASQAGLWPVPSPPYTKASFNNVATAINGLAIESLCDSESRQAYPSSGMFRPSSSAHGMKDYFAAKTAQISTEHVNGLTIRTYKRDRLWATGDCPKTRELAMESVKWVERSESRFPSPHVWQQNVCSVFATRYVIKMQSLDDWNFLIFLMCLKMIGRVWRRVFRRC